MPSRRGDASQLLELLPLSAAGEGPKSWLVILLMIIDQKQIILVVPLCQLMPILALDITILPINILSIIAMSRNRR